MAESSSPVEVFKRSTTAALRAIAEREDVTVTYGPEPPGLAGPRARLPMPPRDLSQQEASLVRGAADALALRLRYHDAQLHARRLPLSAWSISGVPSSKDASAATSAISTSWSRTRIPTARPRAS